VNTNAGKRLPPMLFGSAIGLPVLVFVLLVGHWLFHTRAPYAGTNSVAPRYNLPPLSRRDRLCLRGLIVPAKADALRFRVGAAGTRPVPVTLRLKMAGRAVVSHGTAAPGGFVSLDLPFAAPGRDVPAAGCMTAAGTIAAMSGQPSASSGAGAAFLNGKPVGSPSIWYPRLPARRLISALPDGARHASLFRAGFVGPWLYGVLAVLIVAAWVGGIRLVIRGAR
jgi:hypothetical protein